MAQDLSSAIEPVDPGFAWRAPPRSFWQNVVHRISHDPVTLGCGAILIIIIALALLAPWLPLQDPVKMSMFQRLKSPGAPGHWLGTDELGRDMLSRLVWGARLSLFSSFVPVALATAIGGIMGIVAGYAGGRVNMLIMRLIDVFYAFPSVLLAVAISGAMGSGLFNSLVALTLVFIPPLARVAESVTTQVRQQDFVEAARASGGSHYRIITGHVLSNVVGPIVIYASSLISVSIVLSSGLSFLGLGVSPPDAEWGLMLNALRQAIYVAPIQAVIPGIVIFVTSMCFNLMSDGLRSAMDVKT
jgi:peptide/nickel transport system permease protein